MFYLFTHSTSLYNNYLAVTFTLKKNKIKIIKCKKIEQMNTRAGKICYRRELYIVILFILHVLLFVVVYVILHSYIFNYCKKKNIWQTKWKLFSQHEIDMKMLLQNLLIYFPKVIKVLFFFFALVYIC